MQAKRNPFRALWSVGRGIVRCVGNAIAGNPPHLSVIVMSAVLGFVLDRLPARPVFTTLGLR